MERRILLRNPFRVKTCKLLVSKQKEITSNETLFMSFNFYLIIAVKLNVGDEIAFMDLSE